MARRYGWLSGAVLLAALGCAGDSVTAPGECPSFCTNAGLGARDTVLTGIIRGDSTFRGYFSAQGGTEVQVAGPAGAAQTRGLLRFYAFPGRYQIFAGDTTTTDIVQVDSLRLNLAVRGRAGGDITLAVYRLPRTIDTLATYASVGPYFDDSLKIAELTVSVDTGSTSVAIPASLFPTLAADSFEVALGLAVQAPADGRVRVGAAEAGYGAYLERFIQVDSATVRIQRTDTRLTMLDTYVFPALPPVPAGALVVGGSPSARTFMRVTLPGFLLDSGTVVRATLELVPAGPAVSAASDTLRVISHSLAADVGPKSPVNVRSSDTERRAGAYVPPGSADTIRVDVTGQIRLWQADTAAPRTLVLRAVPEGSSLSEIRFWSSRDATRKPRIRVTYVPPLEFGVR